MSAILLRKEPFGGIAALAGGDTVQVLDHVGFSIFRAVAAGRSDSEILDAIGQSFPGADGASVRETLVRSRQLLDNPSSWESVQIDATDDTGLSFPVLSYPLDLSWEITRRCNQHCLHCYNNSSHEGAHPSWERLEKILDELSAVQLRSLTITGGEPMMRRDFEKFSERVIDLAYNRILSSNATLIDTTNIRWLSRVYNQASISIDVADKMRTKSLEEKKGLSNAVWRVFVSCEKMMSMLSHRQPYPSTT